MEVRLKEKIPGVFWPVHQAIRRGEVTEVVAKGGRGSGKSSYLSMELVWQLLRHPDCHAVVLRKIGGTLRNSVYNQIVWAIGELGCAGYFRCTVSPMECTYLPTGQKILFFGTDDPGKLKSLKLPFGAVGICWFEELDQFDGPEEVRNVEQTVLRGGSWTLTLKSFNPPAMARSWANRYALETRPGKLVHHSTYRDLPRAMLGERFWADAEHLQRTNPAAFRHEYGGEVVGSGAAGLQASFLSDWSATTKRHIAGAEYYPAAERHTDDILQIVPSGPFGKWRALLQADSYAVSNARKRIWIQTPYYLPSDVLNSALQVAALAGIDVRLMLPARSDSKVVDLASHSYLDDMMKAGVKILFYKPGFLHSKLLIIDDSLTVIGSANMDFRSFEHNFEVNAFVYDREFTARMAGVFEDDASRCHALTPGEWFNRPRPRRWAESLMRVFSPLL